MPLKATWIIDVLNDLEDFCIRNELTESARLIDQASSHVRSELNAISDSTSEDATEVGGVSLKS